MTRLAPLALLLCASVAQAHIALVDPPPRSSSLKQGPCGQGPSEPRSANVTTFHAGETITVHWKETIDHPGHYRIAFDPDGQSLFRVPTSFTDVSGGPGVLLDGIADEPGVHEYTVQVTLPDVVTENATLQVIQMMTDKPPYGDGNDVYFQCADLVLVAPPDAGTPADVDAGTTVAPPVDEAPPHTGCSSSSAPVGALLALGLFARRLHADKRAVTARTA
jgi:hypothetical protein